MWMTPFATARCLLQCWVRSSLNSRNIQTQWPVKTSPWTVFHHEVNRRRASAGPRTTARWSRTPIGSASCHLEVSGYETLRDRTQEVTFVLRTTSAERRTVTPLDSLLKVCTLLTSCFLTHYIPWQFLSHRISSGSIVSSALGKISRLCPPEWRTVGRQFPVNLALPSLVPPVPWCSG